LGIALFTILGALAQLERELIRERVKAGLANARAKGRLIGRKKLRDSDLIRKLLKSGISYRQCATIAKCSHGSIHAEKLAMKKEETLMKELLEKSQASTQPTEIKSTDSDNDPDPTPPSPTRPYLKLVE